MLMPGTVSPRERHESRATPAVIPSGISLVAEGPVRRERRCSSTDAAVIEELQASASASTSAR